jgi:hypothetical protein
MTFDYAASQKTANKLIDRFGQAVSVRRFAATGDAWNPTRTYVDHATTGAVVEYANAEIDGTRVLETDRKCFSKVGSLTITPAVGDRLVVGSDDLAIVSVKPLNPAGVAVMYELQVRK